MDFIAVLLHGVSVCTFLACLGFLFSTLLVNTSAIFSMIYSCVVVVVFLTGLLELAFALAMPCNAQSTCPCRVGVSDINNLCLPSFTTV